MGDEYKYYYNKSQMASSVPSSFNPSDYEFLLKSVAEGNIVSKAESLKRFNTLVVTDKKQFAIYAKRVVLSIQDLLTESKEDINLLASTLALEIINLNPRQIEYYIRTKLLKNMVKNLGDLKPQIRKTSHYCLLAYVKTYKTFDELIQVYIHFGIHSESWQLRQKSINSFQSILIMEMKYLNWSSNEFRKMVEQLLKRNLDQSQYVQKASEQCLLSICKFQEIRNFSKKLPSPLYSALKQFCEKMLDQGLLSEIKLYVPELPSNLSKNQSVINVRNEPPPPLKNLEKGQSLLNLQKITPKNQSNAPQSIVARQSLISRIEQIRKKVNTPVKQNPEDKLKEEKSKEEKSKQEEEENEKKTLKKTESLGAVPRRPERETGLPSIRKSINIEERRGQADLKVNSKVEKSEVALGRKLIDDLRNEKDWKVRLEAIEELQNKFFSNKDSAEIESMAKSFLPTLIKLLADPNFKVALIALKIIEEVLQIQNINHSSVVPQLVQKISDGKIALRQNISKLIRCEFKRTGNKIWLNQLLAQLRKSPPPNSNIKQQILNIISKMTIDAADNDEDERVTNLSNSLESIVEAICPMMDDLKTKIKIKTLDLLILLSVKTRRVETVKSILAARLNQVYFEMYLQKISKEIKIHGLYEEQDRGGTAGDKRMQKNQRTMIMTNRRYIKNPGNTTSTSLKKYSSVQDHNTTARTASFIDKKNASNQEKQYDEQISQIANKQSDNLSKKSIIKSYRKKTFDYKSTQYSAFSVNNATSLPPFNDPEKELRQIMVDIKSEEWQTGSQALTKLRRIIENHSELLTQPLTKLLVPEIMRLVESLRSNLSKNAVITLHDLSNKMKKVLDPELDSIFAKLLKKTLDANSFISEEVKRALNSVCSNCNENRVVGLLLNSHTSRAVPIKVAIANVLEFITFLPRFYDKQLERIVGILVNFMGEGSLEIREKAKTLLSGILCSERAKEVLKLIPQQHLNKLKMKEIKPQAELRLENSEFNNLDSEAMSPMKKKKKEKITVFPQAFEGLEFLLEQCEASDWKFREKNMTEISERIIVPYYKELSQHRLAGRVMDVLSKQISDPNVKVASNALKILQVMPSLVPELIEHNLSVLSNEIFNCFGSHKPQIKQLAEQLFDEIASRIQKWMLIQHMCNGVLYGLQKSRPVILNRLVEIIPDVYAKGTKKPLLIKNLYPLINKLAEQNKPQNLQGLSTLMLTCDEQTNGEYLSYLKPKAIQIFNSIKNE